MITSIPTYCPENEELQRLMEVHSDVKEYVENERKNFRNKILISIIILFFILLFCLSEYTKNTRIINRFTSFFKISNDSSKQEKIIPMNCGSCQLIIIPEKLPVTLCSSGNNAIQQFTDNDLKNKKDQDFNRSSNPS